MSGKKSGSFDKDGIEGLAKDKPVVYDIQNKAGKTLYTGSAKRGRVDQRLKEHLPGGPDPIRGGTKVKLVRNQASPMHRNPKLVQLKAKSRHRTKKENDS